MEELYIDSAAHSYGYKQVLNNVYLNCKIGETVGILGRNGSGKSTLLKIIFGSISPDYMHLKLNGKLIKKGYLTNEISYLPQHSFLPVNLKISTLVNLYINKYRKEVLAIDLVNNNLDVPIENLSGGQRRLIECLLLLYSDSTFALLDEPFSQMAPLIADEIQQHIKKLSPVKGFVLTDHYYQQILKISSRIVLLHNGCNYAINHEDDLRFHGYLPNNS